MRKFFIFAVVALIIVVAVIVWQSMRAPSALIIIASPKEGDVIKNPLVFSGKARGSWFFEASFPVRVVDANGKVLGATPAHADGDWMTENFVPFSGSIEFEAPKTPTGTVVFVKDNPSGLPEHDAAMEVPVRFWLP